MPITVDGSSASSGDCITVDDVTSFKINGCEASEILCATTSEIQEHLDEVINMVETITNTLFCPVETCFDFDGSGDFQLYFQPTTSQKLLSVTSVTIVDQDCNSCALPTETIKNHAHFLQYDCKSKFPCGKSNIRVCGTWGAYTTIPTTVKRAIILLTLERIEPGITGIDNNQNQIDSIVWSDLSINYRTTGVDFADISTGIPYVDRDWETKL